ncbi:MAG TPA: hypothetical protein VIV11_36315, partial [Kofleriaceae bacterium]
NLDRSLDTARTIAQGLEGIGDYAHQLEDDTLRRVQEQFYMAALSVALEHVGYEPHTGPGEPMLFRRGEEELEPAAIARKYVGGELSEDTWLAIWSDAGLGATPWADVAWKKPPSQFAA